MNFNANVSMMQIFLITKMLSMLHLTQGSASPALTSFCAGGTHACAVFDSSSLYCWGQTFNVGKSSTVGDGLGDDPTELGSKLPTIDIGTSAIVSEVSCGNLHTCVRLNSGDIKCMGSNEKGQIGIGSVENPIGAVSGHVGDSLPTIDVGYGLKVIDIALGSAHTCIKVTGNFVKCLGYNAYGQLGYGDTWDRGLDSSEMGDNLTLVDLGESVQISSIHSGPLSDHTCAIVSSPDTQKFKCWGRGNYGQLGYGNKLNKGDEEYEMGSNLTFINLGAESKVTQLALGYGHTCAILVNDNMKCFGNSAYGQLGMGTTADVTATGSALQKVPIDTGKTINFLSAGSYHTCITYNDQITMNCVGANDKGQLGQGDTKNRGGSPTTIIPKNIAIDLGSGLLKITAIHSGDRFTCVIFEDSSIKCFGDSSLGQLANGKPYTVGDESYEMGSNLKSAQLINSVCPYTSKTDCKANDLCSWDKVEKMFVCNVFTCSKFTKSKDCIAEKRCSWNSSSKCVAFECSYITSKKSCKKNKSCSWVSSKCTKK